MPDGWVPKSTAPAAFNVGEAFAALISGQPDSWLEPWLYLVGGDVYSAAALCTVFPLTTPPLELGDFLSLIPTSRPSIPAFALGVAETVYTLREKLSAYVLNRLGSAYCQAPGGGIVCTPFDTVVVNDTRGGNQTLMTGDGSSTVHSLPAGATVLRYHLSQCNNVQGVNFSTYFYQSAPAYTYVGQGPDVRPGLGFDSADIPIPAGATVIHTYYDNNQASTFTVQLLGCSTGPTTNPDTPQAEIPGLPPPTIGAYPDLAAVGRELDNQERKLEMIRDMVWSLLYRVAPPFAVPSSPVSGAGVLDISGAKGVVVTVSSIPPGSGELFGTPPKYHRLGRVTFGTADAWFPPEELETNPQVIWPLPSIVTRLSVSVTPPATASVQLLA